MSYARGIEGKSLEKDIKSLSYIGFGGWILKIHAIFIVQLLYTGIKLDKTVCFITIYVSISSLIP